MKIIDIEKWNRKKSFDWFGSFTDPTYALSAKIDVTPLIEYVKGSGRHFYECMLYLTVKALNGVPEMRLRIKGKDVVEYDCPDPSFTVGLRDGLFDICRVGWDDSPDVFCRGVRSAIEQAGISGGNREFGDGRVDLYYFTCLPWLDFETMTNPIPDDKEIAAIPRICWGKYVPDGGRYRLSLSIQVSHALVDGKPLCDAFAAVQRCVDDCARLLG